MLKLKWFPRSWIQIKTSSRVLYIDPAYMDTYFKKYSKRIEFSRTQDEIDALPEDLEKADAILITHIHKDHCKENTIKRLSTEKTTVLSPMQFTQNSDLAVRIVKPNDEIILDDIKIRVVYSYNTELGSSTKKVHKKGQCVGYIVNIENRTIYHAGDTDFIPEMVMFGDIDIALLPIGGTYTMDINDSIRAIKTLKPGIVVPIHHLKADPNEFKAKLQDHLNIDVKILDIGEEFIVD